MNNTLFDWVNPPENCGEIKKNKIRPEEIEFETRLKPIHYSVNLMGDSPINPEFDRAYLLSSLECVDFVVIFDEDTPQQIIELTRPDIVVKGSDYKGKTVVGSEIATVKLVDFVDGKSTTQTIKKINNDK